MKIYELALTPGLRSPFLPPDELHPGAPEKTIEQKPDSKPEKEAAPAVAAPDKKPAARVRPQQPKPQQPKRAKKARTTEPARERRSISR